MKPGNDKVGRGLFFRLGDNPTFAECDLLGIDRNRRPYVMTSMDYVSGNVYGVWTGETRPPRAGEWYLSGAEVRTWRALCDLSDTFHIAKLVVIEEIKTYRIVRELPPPRPEGDCVPI